MHYNRNTPRIRPVYVRRPAPICPEHHVPMTVTHTYALIRYFRCPCATCNERAQQTRDKARESYRL